MAKNRFGATTSFEAHATVTATGTTAANAARLKRGYQKVTGADGTKGVKLPASNKTKMGDIVIIKGITNGVLKVWPGSTGGSINALSADAAMSLASGLVPAIFIADSALAWSTLPLLPS